MNDAIPSGASCFIDANILFYHFVETPRFSGPSSALLARIASGFTSLIAASEALHRIMIAEVHMRFSKEKPLAYIQRRPHLVASLSLDADAATRIASLNLQLLTVDLPMYAQIASIAARHSLLTNDATAVVLVRHYNIGRFATNDSDFDSIPGIDVWKPL